MKRIFIAILLTLPVISNAQTKLSETARIVVAKDMSDALYSNVNDINILMNDIISQSLTIANSYTHSSILAKDGATFEDAVEYEKEVFKKRGDFEKIKTSQKLLDEKIKKLEILIGDNKVILSLLSDKHSLLVKSVQMAIEPQKSALLQSRQLSEMVSTLDFEKDEINLLLETVESIKYGH